ncbi:hypothetical protein KKE60_06585 [Patescibacteria group bacterium]|nr:hypothetical protein [Patescibacteria group bacterium]
MTIGKQETRLRKLAPVDEIALLIREATQSVEDALAIEDAGWINLSGTTGDVISASERITNLKLSRLYSAKDPLGKQSIRLWTDYTFGQGMTSHAPKEKGATEESKTEEVRKSFWDSKDNQAVLSARGQRKSSDKLLIDGEVFFAIFLGSGGEAKIRWIDPLEITEIITDSDDIENVMYYQREWTDAQSKTNKAIYRSTANIKGEPALNSLGGIVKQADDALIYHLTYNTITQRGNPLLLPALTWIKYYTKFMASRIAVMLALAKFAWRTKVTGGQAAVDAIKAKTNAQTIAAGSTLLENLGSDTTPIKTETGAQAAYQDGRQIKLMVAAAVGIPEQYFGDISIGNLATAKTVELPMMKMFQSYQKVWADTYKDIDEIVFTHNNIAEDKQYVDRDFPAIAPEDVAAAATAFVQILTVMPELASADDVKQIALMTLGVNDPAEVLDELGKEEGGATEARLIKALKQFRESLVKKE